MGFCTEAEYEELFVSVPELERMLALRLRLGATASSGNVGGLIVVYGSLTALFVAIALVGAVATFLAWKGCVGRVRALRPPARCFDALRAAEGHLGQPSDAIGLTT